MDTTQWNAEQEYIRCVADAVQDRGRFAPAMRSFNHDPQCFLGYCGMQQRSAEREGHTEAARLIARYAAELRAHLAQHTGQASDHRNAAKGVHA